MTLEADLLAGRAEAEAIMFERVTVSRPGQSLTDDDGVVSTPLEPVYLGKCKLQTTVAQAAMPVSAGHGFVVENLQLHFPIGSGVQVNDSALITASQLDDSNVGLRFRLVELSRGSHRTAARWNVELVTA